MRNLKDIIQEVLVHKHATKDTKQYSYSFDLGKKIKLSFDLNEVRNILKNTLHENDFVAIEWQLASRTCKCMGIIDKDNNFNDLSGGSVITNCKLVIDGKGNVKTNSSIGIDGDLTLRYCTEEECEQLENECKKNGVKL